MADTLSMQRQRRWQLTELRNENCVTSRPAGHRSSVAARRIAELEGWSNVTVRRLSDEISYSHRLVRSFESREGILAAVAIEGFQELGLALEKARNRVKRRNAVESVAAAYLESPRLHQHCMK